MNHPMINMIVEVDILIMARVQATVKPVDLRRILPRPRHSKRAKQRMKRKYVEDSCDSSDTCEPKKRKKNQLGTKRKIIKKKRKSKKKKKSRKATERLSNRKGREKDVIYTALIRLDNNNSRIPVHFSLTSSCAGSFAAFKDKVLEACGLASRKNVQFTYL